MLAGSGWVLLTQLGIQVASFTKSIILARILTPEDFGIFGIAILIVSILQTFSQFGTSAALIHKQDISTDDLNNAWTIQVIRGILFATILLLVAPLASEYYAEKMFLWIMISMALTVLIQGFTNIGLVVFQKQIDFRKIFTINIMSLVSDIILSISIAVAFQSVLALSVGLLVGAVSTTILSFIVHPYRPKLHFNFQGYKALLSYGKWVWFGQIIVFLITEGDDVLVAQMMGPVSLGYYRMAYFISNLPATQLTNTVGQVTFSAFSNVKFDTQQLRDIFYKTVEHLAYLTIPLSFGIYLLVPDFVVAVLGEKWSAVIPIAQILVFWGALRSIGSTTGPLFQAIGKPNLVSFVGLAQIFVILAFIFPLQSYFGLSGVAFAIVISGIVVLPISFATTHRLIKLKLVKLLLILSKPIICSAIMFWVLSILKLHYFNVASIFEIFLLSLIGLILYVLLMRLMQHGIIKISSAFSSFICI